MKTFLAGCLVILVIGVIVAGVATFWAYRAAKPMYQTASEYLARTKELAALGDRIQTKTPFVPPQNGELTTGQVERFLAVQTRVRVELGDRWSELTAKADAIKAKAEASRGESLSLTDVVGVFSDFTGIFIDARRAQVTALNVQKFSADEYRWVRRRVYEAAGVQLAGGLDLSAIEEVARQGAARGGVQVPEMPRPDVPATNVEIIRPHMQKVRELIPLAFLGL